MGICIRFFSQSRGRMITDFLGIVQVTSCTGLDLAKALKEYIESTKLAFENLHAIGTDGAPNMCGQHNSLYSHLKKELPNLILLKCVCHSVDKCAHYAFKKMPDRLTFILSETHNYFAHSAKRLGEYDLYYKALNNGDAPGKLQALSATRWLVWLPVSEQILDQWPALKGFFELRGNEGDFKAKLLADEFKNNSNLLYLTFLRTILKEVHLLNLSFEATEADVSKLYTDLRSLLYSLASRILTSQAIAETTRPDMLKIEEIEMLRNALNQKANLLPLDRVNYGEKFHKLLSVLKPEEEELSTVRLRCGEYIFTLCQQLIDRLPSNLDAINKLKYFTPHLVLAKVGRPTLQLLPVELADPNVDYDILESQWLRLGSLSLADICLDPDVNGDIRKVDTVHFWACVLNLTDAVGNTPFQELALFALKVLSMPISNAVVERVFSILGCIKTKQRNRMQLKMLEALLRVRVHLKVDRLCCKTFQPTRAMYNRFTSQMYEDHHEVRRDTTPLPSSTSTAEETEELGEEDFEILTLFDANGSSCVVTV